MEHKNFRIEFGTCSGNVFILSFFKRLNHGKLLKNSD